MSFVGGSLNEEEMRVLLRIHEGLEKRIARHQDEIEDMRRAIAELDRIIVRQGFQKPVTPAPEEDEEKTSVKSKDGTLLGTLQVDDRNIVFTLSDRLEFATSIPPFQSFLVERVLANMRTSDEERAAKGEISPDEVLSYEVSTDGERLRRVVVHNYGGDRRLREIRSSLRWTFDKMYEKLTQG